MQPLSLPTPSLLRLPEEIFHQILTQSRVNDQICLALTSHHLYSRILANRSLACHSPKTSVRYETWRFNWMGDTLPKQLPRAFNERDLRKLGLGERLVVRAHLKRCRKSSLRDLRVRLGEMRRSTEQDLVSAVIRPEERRVSSRKAAVLAQRRMSLRKAARQATAKIQKMHKK